MLRLASIALIVLCLGFTACGGGDDAPSTDEFANEAERVCKEAEQDLETLGQDAESPEAVATAIDKVIDRTQETADQLVDLERPEGEDGETAERFVEGFKQELDDQVVPALEELRDAVEENDVQATQAAAQRLQQLEASASDRFARELGATACAGS
jgi:hypothetical protein